MGITAPCVSVWYLGDMSGRMSPGNAPSGDASWNPSFLSATVHTTPIATNNTKKKSKLFIFLVSGREITCRDVLENQYLLIQLRTSFVSDFCPRRNSYAWLILGGFEL